MCRALFSIRHRGYTRRTEHGLMFYTGTTEKLASRNFKFRRPVTIRNFLLYATSVLTRSYRRHVGNLITSHDCHIGSILGRKSKCHNTLCQDWSGFRWHDVRIWFVEYASVFHKLLGVTDTLTCYHNPTFLYETRKAV
jgi:hypothetical protein